MIGRSAEILAADPNLIDLDAAKRIDQQEAEHARRIAAAPLPALPPRTAALLRREALARLGLTPDQMADLASYAVSREHRTHNSARADGQSPPAQR